MHLCSTEVIDAPEFLAARPPGDGGRKSGAIRARRGLATIALPPLDPQTGLLAEHLSGGAAIHYGDLSRERLSRFQSALVLFSPLTPAHVLSRALASLSRRGLPFSVLPVASGGAGRLVLLKSFLFPAADIVDVDQIGDLSNAHATMEDMSSRSAPADEHRRILLLSGHGNSVDLGGRGIVVCPRHQPEAGEDAALFYPCFADGLCFRQPLFGRAPQSRQGLLDPSRFRHAMVLLVGCGTFPLGDVPFDHRGTILWRMAAGDSLAAVAILGVFYHDLNVETALMALLLDGHELAQAVHLFNRWYRRAHGRTSPAAEGSGPVVAIGHPGFRLESRLVQAFAPAPHGAGSSLEIPAQAVRFSQNGLAIVKVQGAPPQDHVPRAICPPPLLRSAGVSIELSGRDEEAATYISLQPGGCGETPGTVALLPYDLESIACDIATVRDSVAHLNFWRLLLTDAASPMASALGSEGARLSAAFRALEWERIAFEYLSTHSFGLDGVFPTHSEMAVHELVMDRRRAWQALTLEASCLYVTKTGGFLFHLWQQFYDRERGETPLERCPNCLGDTFWLLHRSHTDPSDQHRIVHCPACGVIGELPGGIMVHAHRATTACQAAGTLTLDFEVRNERAAPLSGFVTVIREDWFHDLHDAAAPVELIVLPGCGSELSIPLSISPGLAPGLYPLTLLGVLNGGLVQVRRHVSIEAAR